MDVEASRGEDAESSGGEVDDFQAEITGGEEIKPIETIKSTLGRIEEAHSEGRIEVEEAA
jgi:hypothetical protein